VVSEDDDSGEAVVDSAPATDAGPEAPPEE
jgi:hypothetical protein